MTFKDLSQLHYIQKEINVIKNEIADLDDKLKSITQSANDMPHSSGISDKIGALTTNLVYQKEMLMIKNLQLEAEKTRLISFIDSIDDSLLRLIFRYRFIELKSWKQVALSVGGNNTADSCRKAVMRYLKNI